MTTVWIQEPSVTSLELEGLTPIHREPISSPNP